MASNVETESLDAEEFASRGHLVGRRFALTMLVAAACVIALVVLAVQLVDPYGVSPLGSRIEGFNAIKPERVDIDRLIKPYEVWAKRPKTIFLGTSRIHQSIDPSALS